MSRRPRVDIMTVANKGQSRETRPADPVASGVPVICATSMNPKFCGTERCA